MVRIEGEIVIKRPVEEVFDFVADERNEPRYNPHMRRAELISTGPIGLGTRFRAEMSRMGRATEMITEFTGYERPHRLASSTHLSAMEIEGSLIFDPVPEGTRMDWSWKLEPRGVLKLMSPLVARMGKRQEETIWANLKQLLERDASPPPADVAALWGAELGLACKFTGSPTGTEFMHPTRRKSLMTATSVLALQ